MVELQPSKLIAGVRFPLPAPNFKKPEALKLKASFVFYDIVWVID
jgi:hypothetical protein